MDALGEIKKLLGDSSTVRQFLYWSVFSQFAGATLAPLLAEEQQALASKFPNMPLTPSDAVDAVIKSHWQHARGVVEAALSGIDSERFQTLIDSAGEPPGVETLIAAARRGFIATKGTGASATSVEQGILESRIKNKWIPMIEQLSTQLLPVADIVDAWVEGQVPEGQARKLLAENGVSDDDATVLFNTRGNPPSPAELIELVRRRLIPLQGVGPDHTSLQQGIFEGATKDKWEPFYEKLTRYVPPPRTITALQHSGAITDEEALQLYQDNGLDARLAAIYVADAHHTKTQQARDLAKGDIEGLYLSRLIDSATATDMLKLLGYSADDAALLLSLQDFHRTKTQVDNAISRLQTLFVNHRVSDALAGTTLDGLGLTTHARDELLRLWKQERELNIKVLTAAEIVSAVKYQLMSEADALTLLRQQGYTEFDAWMRLAVGLHQSLSTPPPAGPVGG